VNVPFCPTTEYVASILVAVQEPWNVSPPEVVPWQVVPDLVPLKVPPPTTFSDALEIGSPNDMGPEKPVPGLTFICIVPPNLTELL
jgi:hypothetical protein